MASGAIAERSSTSRFASPLPGPIGWPPSIGITFRRPSMDAAWAAPKKQVSNVRTSE
ncbi:MAG: hypothetical protein WB557_23515 [Solirubrobacteraceae bacterium]